MLYLLGPSKRISYDSLCVFTGQTARHFALNRNFKIGTYFVVEIFLRFRAAQKSPEHARSMNPRHSSGCLGEHWMHGYPNFLPAREIVSFLDIDSPSTMGNNYGLFSGNFMSRSFR
jgi:hypothetical protein